MGYGYTHPLLSDVDALKHNIRERYDDDAAMLRELLQNADDAEAERLVLGWTRGIPGSDHPLLNGPLLFAANDGFFRPEDARRMLQISGGSKGDAAGKIGRFGLGIKSVYRLCEALIVFDCVGGSTKTSLFGGREKPPGRMVINPWLRSDEQLEQEPAEVREESRRRRGLFTDLSEADEEAVRRHLAPVCPGDQPWLGVLIPLRREAQAPDPNFRFHETTPDAAALESLLGPEATAVSLAGLLPLLSHVRSISLVGPETGAGLTPLRLVELEAGSTRHFRRSDEVQLAAEATFSGTVHVRGADAAAEPGRRLRYTGVGRCLPASEPPFGLDDRAVGELRTDDRNGAAVLTVEEGVPPNAPLRQWATYLPVGKTEPLDGRGAAGQAAPRLILHGSFMPDTGRREIAFLQEDFADSGDPRLASQRTSALWNHWLRRRATLPCLIPLLERLAAGDAADAAVVRPLTAGLERWAAPATAEGQILRAAVCSEAGWACCVNLTGGVGYRRLASAERALRVPPPPESFGFETDLPPLAEVLRATGRVAVVGTEPALLLPEQEAGLTDGEWVDLLDACDAEALLEKPTTLGFLLNLLRLSKIDNAHPAADAIMRLTRRLLGSPDQKRLLRRKRNLAGLLQLVPRHRVVVLRFPSEAAKSAGGLWLGRLAGFAPDVLMAPAHLAELAGLKGSAAAALDPATSERLLASLAEDPPPPPLQDADLVGWRHTLAAGVADATAPHPGGRLTAEEHGTWLSRTLDRFALTPALVVPGAGERVRALFRVSALRVAYDAGRLFLQSPGSERQLLAAAIRADVLEVEPASTARAWVEAGLGAPLGAATREAAATAVLRNDLRPELPPRISLLKWLLRGDELTDTLRNACRRLIVGGDVEDPNAVLLQRRDCPQQTLLDALRASDTATHHEAAPEFTKLLNPTQRSNLKVVAVDPAAAAKAWRDSHPSERRDAEVKACFADNAAWRRRLIADWPGEHRNDLRSLPLFETLDGSLVSIDDDEVFREGGVELGGRSLPGLRVLRSFQEEDSGYAKRLAQLVEPLSAEDAVALAMEQPDPSGFESLVLGLLPGCDTSANALGDKLRGTSWLTTTDGRKVAPASVCGGIDDKLIASVPDWSRFGLVLPDELRVPFVDAQHPAAELFCKPADRNRRILQSLERLGLLCGVAMPAAEGADGYTGRLPGAWLAAFAEPDLATKVMPGAAILASLPKREQTAFATGLRAGFVSRERLIGVLEAIRLAHEGTLGNEHRERRRDLRRLFADYLEAGVGDDVGLLAEMLRTLPLPRADGRWAEAGADLYSDAAVPPDRRLAEELFFLTARLPQPEPPELRSGSGDPEQELLDWVRRAIDQDVPPRLATLPLLVFGFGRSRPGFRERAAEFLSAAEVEGQHEALASFVTRYSQPPRDVTQVLETDSVRLHLAEPGKRFLRSTSGRQEKFDAVDSAFFQKHPTADRKNTAGHREYTLSFSPVDVPRTNSEAWTSSLRAALIACRCDHAGLEAVVRIASKADQAGVGVAQRKLLSAVAFSLRGPLKVPSETSLMKALRAADDHHREAIELEEEGIDAEWRRNDEAKSLAEVRRLLEEDEPSQHALLQAVRQRLQKDGYNHESVPFELFQNADDAVGEWRKLVTEPKVGGAALQRFELHVNRDGLLVVHHGRWVNQDRFRGRRPEGCEGFRNDLENMLNLGHSDKADSGRNSDGGASVATTGHFGLGFKSTLFLSDRPRLASGPSLAVEIRGGVYPIVLEAEEREMMLRQVATPPKPLRPTIVRLPPADKDQRVAQASAAERFEVCAPLLVHFANHLREVVIRRGSEITTFRRGGSRSDAGGGFHLVRQPWTPGEPGDELLVAVSAGEDRVRLALVLRDGGIDPDALAHLPTFWSMAPTQERMEAGFAFNAPFHLDQGRTRIVRGGAGDPTGRAEETLGDLLGEVLLRVADECGVAGLARSVRDLAGTIEHRVHGTQGGSASVEAQALRAICFDDGHGGFARLWRERPAFATGMPTGWPQWVSLEDAGLRVAEGILDLAEARTAAADLLPASPPVTLAPGRLGWLKTRGIKEPAASPIKLIEILRNCPILQAGRLGPQEVIAITPLLGFLLRLRHDPVHEDELRGLVELLGRCQVQTEAGGFAAVSRVCDSTLDEALHSFAPLGARCADGIKGAASSLFLLLRDSFPVDPLFIAAWAAAASGLEAKRAAIAFLAGRNCPDETLNAIAENVPGWITNLDTGSPEVARLAPASLAALAQHLGLSGLRPPVASRGPAGEAYVAPDYRDRCLRFYEWAVEDPASKQRSFEFDLYGTIGAAALSPDDVDDVNTDHRCRREWTMLLNLASLQAMGRVQQQAHRNFLETRGLDVYAGMNPEDFKPWADLIRDPAMDFGDGKFRQWILNLPDAYRIALCLSDFMERLDGIGRDDGSLVPLAVALDGRGDARQSGSNHSVPPIPARNVSSQTLLIQELFRRGFYDAEASPGLVKHALWAKRSVRDTVSQLTGIDVKGQDTSAVHEALRRRLPDHDLTFGGLYGIPLYLLEHGKHHPMRRELGLQPPQRDGGSGGW